MILSDTKLDEALGEDVRLEPRPPDDAIKPASIDLALGREAYRAEDDEKTLIDRGEILRLPAGAMAIVLTKERIELSEDIVGSIGLRSKYTRKGVDRLAGPQIDPGFEGPLHLTLINLSPTPLTLSEGERFCTVEFHKLPEPPDETYDGEYQDQARITSDEIRDLSEGDHTLSELHQSMSNISENVGKIENNIDRMERNYESLSRKVKWHISILTAILAALVAAIIGNMMGAI